ncbi:hypothetical protein [Eudoraea adriatica]|uniref:hypothetical protein n=1 Tax=Eudoraea adriatica TaxID=446681 RepID=UPI000377472D|nr:hypothetical protein [Eudoraea adriatica]
MKKFFLPLLFIILIYGCSKDEQSVENNSNGNSTTNENSANIQLNNSLVQKGPFVEGSSILIVELNEDLESTSISYNTETVDDFGSFEFNSSLGSDKIDIVATGFYFNEITGQLSSGQVTLRNFIEVQDTQKANINILTTLSRQRIKYLMTANGVSYDEAKNQAEREVLLAFNIPQNIIDASGQFQDMDISKEGTGNAILLAISCVLQGNNSDGELSELITKFANDLENDGILDDSFVLNKIKDGGSFVNPQSVRENLEQRFGSLGITYSIPDFEFYIDFDGNGKVYGYDVTASHPLEAIANTKPTFEWNSSAEEGETYDVQLSENSNFSNLIFDISNIDDVQLVSPESLQRGITYYWRIRMKNGENIGDWKVNTFSVNNVIFSNLSPRAVEELGVELEVEISDSDPLISWEDNMTENGTYQFQLSADLDFNDILIDVNNLVERNYQITFPLTNKAYYFYRIRFQDDNGAYSEWAISGFRFILPPIGSYSANPSGETWGDTTPLFDWSEPYFLEPDYLPETMTYQLQVATDPDFTNIIVDADNIQESQYQSTSPFSIGGETETGQYYWRVRYYDQNNIFSDWSNVIGFFISP